MKMKNKKYSWLRKRLGVSQKELIKADFMIKSMKTKNPIHAHLFYHFILHFEDNCN